MPFSPLRASRGYAASIAALQVHRCRRFLAPATLACCFHRPVATLHLKTAAFACYRVAMNGARIGLYEPTKRALRTTFPWLAGSGGLASSMRLDLAAAVPTGMVGAVLGNPFQVIKTRTMAAQAAAPSAAAIPPSFVRTAIAILRAEGPAAFALGLSAAVPRVIVGRYLRFALARVLLARCANVRLARVHCMRLFVGVDNDTAAPHNWLRTMR